MKKLILFLFLVTLLLTSIATAENYDTTCCVLNYVSPDDVRPIYPAETCYVGYTPEKECFDSVEQKYTPGALDVGCCCLDGTIHYVPGGNAAYPELASRVYCEAQGYDFKKPNADQTCNDVCDGFVNQDINSQYVIVDGYINVKVYDEAPRLYEGAIVTSMFDYAQVKTDRFGYYNLKRTPGDPLGANEFRATVPEGKEIACNPGIIKKILTNSTQLNFTLECWEQTPDCQPDWEYSEWSDYCYPFEGKFYYRRTAVDKNNCDSTIGLASLSYECTEQGNIYGACGNNKFDEGSGEQCDNGVFYNPLDQKTTKELNCNQVDEYVYGDGKIKCNQATCAYDYSECELNCDPNVCRNRLDCEKECPACKDNTAVCGDTCYEAKPKFLETWRNESGLLTTSRNVFDLYDFLTERSSFTRPPIKYNQTTKDVFLEWEYEQQCRATIKGYKLQICEEDENTNYCKSQTKQELLIENPIILGSWMEDVLKPSTSYCYNVCAIKNDGRLLCAINQTGEELPCFSTGNEICLDETKQPGLNCEYNSEAGKSLPQGCSEKKYGQLYLTNLSLRQTTSDLITDCLGKICVETQYDKTAGSDFQGAKCVPQAACSLCNGLFGLYANYNLNTKITKFDDGEEYIESPSCFDLEYNFLNDPTEYPTEENSLGLCYQDKSKTITTKFDTCEMVTSCYDYDSENACQNDPCFKFVNLTGKEPKAGCEWNYLKTKDSDENLHNELGIGVCRPKDEKQQECLKCDYDAPLGFCSEDQCNLYGECYYKEESNHNLKLRKSLTYLTQDDTRNTISSLIPTCINKEEVSCYYYDTKEECLGESYVSSEIDIQYDNETIHDDEVGQRIFGTNKITKSEDKYGIGLCRWNDNEELFAGYGCVKDADGSIDMEGEKLLDDCAKRTPSQECLTDKTPPETKIVFKEGSETSTLVKDKKIPVYGLGEIELLEFSAIDDASETEEIITYASFVNLADCKECLTQDVEKQIGITGYSTNQLSISSIKSKCYDKGCDSYPQRNMNKLNPAYEPFTNLKSGEYALIYYSEDESHNLEVVQALHLYIDNSSPIIKIEEKNINIQSIRISEDIYKSNLNITFYVDGEEKPSRCEGHLYDSLGNPVFESSDVQGTAKVFKAKYYNLIDGYYNYTMECVDEYQNRAFKWRVIEVQGDMSINNPLPRGEIYKSPDEVTLSINTSSKAKNCWYSLDRYNYPDNQKFQSGTYDPQTKNQYHTISFSGFDLSQTGTWLGNYEFTIFTACEFDQNITEGNLGDIITFSVDNREPMTKIFVDGDYDIDLVDFEENMDFTDERSLYLSCDDSNALTENLYYGCKEIDYCFADYMPDLESFTANDCDGGEWIKLFPENQNEKNILTDLSIKQTEIGSSKHIYFRSIDKGNNIEELQRKNLRIRDVDFFDPEFSVSKIVK